MAALDRPTKATYEVHENVQIDTQDNEDHTFCGIMFPIRAKSLLPVEEIIVRSVSVRGHLGPMTVWVTNDHDDNNNSATNDDDDDELGGRPGSHFLPSTRMEDWVKIYEATHPPSPRKFQELDFSDHPVVLRPGQMRGIYVHSARQDDRAIVYDNSTLNARHWGRYVTRYQDALVAIRTGRAHLSDEPFGDENVWGWGRAWRDHREFVGRVNYGCRYKLWNPHQHVEFGRNFHSATQTILACQRRAESPLCKLPDECIYYILNMCKWDWFQDTVPQEEEETNEDDDQLENNDNADALPHHNHPFFHHHHLPRSRRSIIRATAAAGSRRPGGDDHDHHHNQRSSAAIARALANFLFR